jgi:TolA-binding protein
VTKEAATAHLDVVATPKPNEAPSQSSSTTLEVASPNDTRPNNEAKSPSLMHKSNAKTPDPMEVTRTELLRPPADTVNLPHGSTAAELFAAANQARQRGDFERAVFLYHQLNERYPEAHETAISNVLLARLDLRKGSAESALNQFVQYLRLEPNGPLAEEALEGKAQAYRQLGRTAEEQQTLHELLQRFPRSVYGEVARKRLDALQ